MNQPPSATNMPPISSSSINEFDWKCQPAAAQMLQQLVDDFCEDCDFAENLRTRMLRETGTRLIDWLDHLTVGSATKLNGQPFESQLLEFGYKLDVEDSDGRWYRHDEGLFVPICVAESELRRMVVKVESVVDFLAAHRLAGKTVEGEPLSQFRRVLVSCDDCCEIWVCQRQGYQSWSIQNSSPAENSASPDLEHGNTEKRRLLAAIHFETFKLRQRRFDDNNKGFAHAKNLIQSAIADLGVDWTCDLFFAAERDYWQRRNQAAQFQKGRQDRLGLGWANHDHHTYRSSRKCFAELIAVFELLGFHCRERFYAGEQAGWGAQVLEQSTCGIVIFADVDLTPKELVGDFSHAGLAEKSEMGTVGLWCQLHGEAFLQAGMHHLECTFDFEAARKQLDQLGVKSMAPFTDFGYLRQSFTTGEIWPVERKRVEEAVERGFISRAQADKFLSEGVLGSHLEILERNEGFKGFNQTGVSEIIKKTDPRSM